MMMNHKKWIKGTIVLGAGLLLAACGNDQGEHTDTGTDADTAEETTRRIGASNDPRAEILEFVAPKVEEEGITSEIEHYNDYVIHNVALVEAHVDANYFHHVACLE